MLDSVQKRDRHLANRCPLCGEDDKNIDHLLLICKKIGDLWVFLFAPLESLGTFLLKPERL